MWRGHPYADVDGRSELHATITHLNELRLTAIERRIDAELDAGSSPRSDRRARIAHDRAPRTGEVPCPANARLVPLRPSNRSPARLRERTRSYLVEEMGLDPSPELQDLEQRILTQDPTLDASNSATRSNTGR